MRIFSKASLQFDHPEQAVDPVVVQYQAFTDVPDWVAKSAMFKLALKNETITVIESRQDEVKAQYGDATNTKAERERLKAEAKEKARLEAEAAKAEEERLKAEAEALAQQPQ